MRLALCDAQTSGGLLIAVGASHADLLAAALKRAGVATIARIGVLSKGAQLSVV
jgi:selenophosphate synthase